MAAMDAPQCTQMLESHGGQWRCGRRAARKHGYKLCGHCAALAVKRCGRGGKFVYHEAECAGCAVPCCADRALCGPNCFEGRDADGRPLPVKK
jgi:hypothetical protein